MATSTRRIIKVAGITLSAISILLLLNTIFRHSSNNPPPTKLRVEEPVVVILVHPSPTLNRAANFELKRAIARTWAKDVEDFGANVFFVGEHDGETVMRRPSEFQGRAQSLSMRFMDPTDGAEEGGIGGGGNGGRGGGTTGGSGDGGVDSAEEDYSRQEPMRKMLIPSILENGQADGASGLLKAYHFLYNNTNWYAGPMLHTYPFILTTDTTHYIHVENLVTTLLSSRPRRLLTMKDDHSFTGSFSEASECSAEDFGDKVPPVVVDYQSPSATKKKTASLQHTHWTLSGTHLVSRQLVALIGPHLHQCVLRSALTLSSSVNKDSSDGGEAFQECIQQWASHPLFWKNGYCGRLAALRSTYETLKRKDRRGLLPPSPMPEDFESFYRMKQRERAQIQAIRSEAYNEVEDKSTNHDDEDGDPAMENGDYEQENLSAPHEKNGKTVAHAPSFLSENTAGSTTHWIVGSGLTQPEDFTFLYQTVIEREKDDQNDANNNDSE
ncbi:hypothetical protein BGZ97_001118 [Linnemannia gamsii]|uniref:Uncharacterized protein n=1 Tax=Linnemannia gamsii TaxID=64522 RepID=A0A9P6UJK9_9FUNG|nr:hypothetical protein BGZ97_001118 [Linnemannia gamsii]